MESVNPQLQAHFSIGLNTGITDWQMRSLILVLKAKVGKKEADNADEVFRKALSTRPAPR
jgi:4-carboxymuconolactone decarboxylase